MLGTLRCLRCQPAVRSWPTVGHTLQSGHGLGRQSGRLRATGQKAQLELEVKLLQQTVDALRRAAEAERLRADEARLRADAERRAAEAERQKADEARQKADLIEQSLRTELAFVRGTLNMQGELEEAEREFRAAVTCSEQKAAQMRRGRAKTAPQPQSRADLWELLLEQEASLAQCFEEMGWARQDAPKKIAKLHKLLSQHGHNEFQLSPRRVDIVEGVVDKEQAQALACICDYLKLDWQITSRYSTSEGSEQEE